MAIRSIKTVRTSTNERFKLFGDVMRGEDYFMYRSDLHTALYNHDDIVKYLFPSVAGTVERLAYIDHGFSQRQKKFISIGCMKFVGDNRTAILKWAK